MNTNTKHKLTLDRERTDRMCRELENVCRICAPTDLRQRPFYICDAADIGWGASDIIGAYTRNLSLVCKPFIPNWRGPAPCIVINVLAVHRMASTVAKTSVCNSVEGWFEALHIVVALHEFAHAIVCGLVWPTAPTPEQERKFEALRVDLKQRVDDDQTMAVDEGRSDDYHGFNFIRASLHLQHRARTRKLWLPILDCAGLNVHTRWLCGNNADEADYESAIKDEPERRAEQSLKDILESPAPAEFCKLFDQRAASRVVTDAL